ncbi:hypothetical protein conserved [Leishmania donovani]|uniref:Uncharacterized protein n=3 Tax=Leishmania donovani species complex TaxID=38574 RepID=A4HYY8_LEIIN|nr:conserved hypothetical protein [Leishmania infantum JPCM5]CAC9484765.1 hypothetical_protein_-_conserved [Leishmania infantum]CAJ1988440.1 hypothetical protein conserved [Leishmania donovani]CAM67528.1 conserved hypothetical protein [Leishmania infantum JPCM5]SUZ41426.1 hypothetical_protein_-_conserved [Leishmania infantum]VDZ44321.1 hypothetical_protein_conserved [Leishmania donovani]|eukprot:XP_001465279.1 conserved hypothetical protein [Leishmania infantum JPCM5]
MSGVATRPEAATTPVSVQLTPIVPIRVFDAHGEYFDTEMDIDAPLRSLQLAIEDYFKVKPEVQLLLHNRQQIHADRSLRDNGCLLLKGDPYVKLVCLLKRGPVLNLQCEVGPITYVVACHEMATVWEVKKMLCEEMERQQRRAAPGGAASRRLTCGPERLRLLWRYMELNDKATLHYYRISTNAVLHVMHRRRASLPAAAAASSPLSRETGLNRTVTAQQPSTAAWWQQPRAASASPSSAACAPAASTASVPEARLTHSPLEAYTDAFGAAARPCMALPVVSAYTQPPPSLLAAAEPMAAYAGPVPDAPQHHHDPLTSSEVVTLSLAVRSLEAQLRSLQQEQRQVEQYQQSLTAYQRGSLADAQQRILELEETVKRFHALLQRAVALIPAAA